MSLFDKLINLNKKINFYSNFLNNKIEKLNNTPISNEETKIAEWNKCKNNLNKKLIAIDNKLNTFIKDSYKCIDQLENDKFKFGQDEEMEEMQIENQDNVPNVNNNEINIKKNFTKMINQNNLNIKLYNCLLYGTFSKELFRKKVLEENYYNYKINHFKKLLDDFIVCLKNNNVYLAGGYINAAINYPEDLIYRNKIDLDLYLKKNDFMNFFNDLKNIGEVYSYQFNFTSPYMESFFKKNGLVGRFVISFEEILIDILIIRDDYDLINLIKNFDLTYCSVYLDPQDLIIKGNIEDMISKSGKLNDEYAKDYLFNKFIQKRLYKYRDRGYKTLIKTTIDIIFEDPLKNKTINNSVMINKLFELLYQKYNNNVPIEMIVDSVCVVDYNKRNLIMCAKRISRIIYENENYYYYLILDLIKYIIEKLNPLIISNGVKKNNTDFLKLLNKFKDELIENATKNNEKLFLQKPNFIPNIIKSFLNDSNVLNLINIINPSFNVNINLIYELNNIYNLNKNLDLNEILLKSNNNFLSNPKYINILIFILGYCHNMKNSEKVSQNVLQDYWFMQIKFNYATIINIHEFKNEITEYKSSDINFDEIMYYDLFEAEEKLFDEIFNDEENLLFVLEDTKKGFTYTFDTLTSNSLIEFILECTQDVLSAPILDQIKNKNTWYVQLSSPYNIGILYAQIYQAYSLYQNSNKKIRKFILSSPKNLEHVSNINAIQWNNNQGLNIWGEQINLVSATHCGIGMKVYDKIKFKI